MIIEGQILEQKLLIVSSTTGHSGIGFFEDFLFEYDWVVRERKIHEVEEERPNNNNEGFMLLTCILQQLDFPLWVYELFPKVQGWVGVEEGGGEGGSGLMGN